MSLSKFTAFFLLVFFSIFAVMNYDVQKYVTLAETEIELDNAIDTAIDAAIDGVVMSADGFSVEVSREKCAQNFYRALYASLGVADSDSVSKELVQNYVPVLAFLDEDGVYVQYSEVVNGKVTKVWGPKTTYTEEFSVQSGALPNDVAVCVVDFSMGDNVTIRVDGTIYSDDWHTLKSQYVSSQKAEDAGIRAVMNHIIFASNNSFNLERDSVITSTVVECVGYFINKHNSIAARYGDNFYFELPASAESDIARSVESPSFMCMFQGYPIKQGTGVTYSKFAFGGARVARNKKYSVARDGGYLYYHTEGCEHCTGEKQIYSTREECALRGAMPCEYCRP